MDTNFWRCTKKTALNGMEITAIESNDSGQGYFVKVDGVSIFHPGDHTNRQRDFSGPFKKEIDFLADLGFKADILFAPVSGCGFGDIVAVKKGVYYAMDRLRPARFSPCTPGATNPPIRNSPRKPKNGDTTTRSTAPSFPVTVLR